MTDSKIIREKTIGPCRLIQGDCVSVLPLLGRVDAVVTDPPYGIGINRSNRLSISRGHGGERWDEEPCDERVIEWILSSSLPSVVWGGNYFNLPPAKCFIVWDKINDGRDFADMEYAWTNLDLVARIHRQRPMNMDGGKVHPTQKPIDLMCKCIEMAGVDGVYADPFMGSGTTGVACIRKDRHFIGIEREAKYFDIACDRIQRAWDLKCSELPFEEPQKLTQRELLSEGLV